MILGLAFPLAIILPALTLGLINYLYWRRQGYKSLSFVVLGTIAIYGLLYQLGKNFI